MPVALVEKFSDIVGEAIDVTTRRLTRLIGEWPALVVTGILFGIPALAIFAAGCFAIAYWAWVLIWVDGPAGTTRSSSRGWA